MSTDYRIVIPARMASERLPGKPLRDIAGKPLIERVWDRATQSGAAEIVIATDDESIREAVEEFGGQCVMTRREHASGSDRIAECIDILGWPDDTLVVNLQGDEPQMPPQCLDQVAALLRADAVTDAASIYQLMDDPVEIRNPNAVKVTVDARGRALYFSRSVIPFNRGWPSLEAAVDGGQRWKRHIGLYAYRAGALRRMAASPPTPLELSERLEQLRMLEAGGVIMMAEAAMPVPAGVDTPEDLERVRRTFA